MSWTYSGTYLKCIGIYLPIHRLQMFCCPVTKRHRNELSVGILHDKVFVSFTLECAHAQFAHAQPFHPECPHICNRDWCNSSHSSWSVLHQRVTKGAPFMVPPKREIRLCKVKEIRPSNDSAAYATPLPCKLPIQPAEGGNTEMLRRAGIACHLKRLIL